MLTGISNSLEGCLTFCLKDDEGMTRGGRVLFVFLRHCYFGYVHPFPVDFMASGYLWEYLRDFELCAHVCRLAAPEHSARGGQKTSDLCELELQATPRGGPWMWEVNLGPLQERWVLLTTGHLSILSLRF